MSKVILFDLGGVLLKSLDTRLLYKGLNSTISYQKFLDFWLYDDVIIDAHKGLISDDMAVSKLLEYVGSDLTLSDFYELYASLSNKFYEETIKIVKNLKSLGYKVGLLSNLRLMDFNCCKETLDALKFDYVFLSYDLGLLKPEAEIYEYVIRKCNCNPSDIYFFDDNEKNIDGARKMGIMAFRATGNNILAVIENLNIL